MMGVFFWRGGRADIPESHSRMTLLVNKPGMGDKATRKCSLFCHQDDLDNRYLMVSVFISLWQQKQVCVLFIYTFFTENKQDEMQLNPDT